MVRVIPVAYLLFVAGLCAAIVSTREPGLEPLRAMIRATAFTSAVAFLPTFTASALFRFRPSSVTRWLVANRRYLGLSVAASHFWHLIALITFARPSPTFLDSVPAVTLAFGGGGFVVLALMAATSTDAAQRRLGRAWGALHTTGVYLLWLVFTATYLGPAASSPFHALMTLVFGGALVLRLAARARCRVRAAAV